MKHLLLDNISALCKSKGISISRLEKTLEFGNGTIRMWANSSPSIEKVKLVAEFFDVSVDSLISDCKKSNASSV